MVKEQLKKWKCEVTDFPLIQAQIHTIVPLEEFFQRIYSSSAFPIQNTELLDSQMANFFLLADFHQSWFCSLSWQATMKILSKLWVHERCKNIFEMHKPESSCAKWRLKLTKNLPELASIFDPSWSNITRICLWCTVSLIMPFICNAAT